MAVEAQFCSQDLMISAGDGFDNTSLCFDAQHSSLPFVGFPHIIDSLAQKQQREIDKFIIDQYEGLRLNLQELRKRDLTQIIKRIETKSRHVLIQKEQDIARARNRTAQLELILHKAQTEHQQWRNLAVEKEAQVIHLNNTLQQMLQLNSVFTNEEKDAAESCCEVEKNSGGGVGLVCRGCGIRDACVLLLPCRHLCCCVVCELRIGSCLVCSCLKQSAIQVSMS